MRLMFDRDLLDLFELIRTENHTGELVYLVGGAIRDLFPDSQIHDMDFVLGENPTLLAKRLAKRLRAGFFVLDDERHTARVVYYDQTGQFFPLDFVQFTGSSLEEDLRNRDFTINAMALSLDDLTQVIDPLHGLADLKAGCLRTCSDHALVDDPVRVLRGARLAVQFDMGLATGLEAAMQAAAFYLPKTSYERQRDEFFRILGGPDPAKGLRFCKAFKVFHTMIPTLVEKKSSMPVSPGQFSCVDHAIQTVENLHCIINGLGSGQQAINEMNWQIEDALRELSKFSNQMASYFTEVITPGRSKAALAYFSTLLQDIGYSMTLSEEVDLELNGTGRSMVSADLAWGIAKRLQLSNAESDWVRKLVCHRKTVQTLMQVDLPVDRRTLYRFFKKVGDVGVALAVHLLAETMAYDGSTLTAKRWEKAFSIVRSMLSAWWDHQDKIISPTPLLNGDDLQRVFGLEPGKRIGHLLSQLVEEQASGNINTPKEAEKFIQGILFR